MQTAVSTIPQLVDQAARHYPDALFLEEGRTRISFGEFAHQVRAVVGSLMALDIRPGDRVAVWAPNISEWVIAAIGAQCAGAVLVTLNTRYKGSEAAYILQQSRARLLFCIGEFLGCDYPAQLQGESLPALEHRVVLRASSEANTQANSTQTWEHFLELGTGISAATIQQRMDSVSETHLSDILFTSGTTGHPKGVMTRHEQNLRAFTHFADIVGLQTGDRYLVINPFFHSFGYKAGILVCLLKGVTLLPHAVFNTEAILQRISDDRISVLPGPPTLFQSLLAHPQLEQFDLSSLRRATTGAAVIPVEMIRQMKSRLGFETVITAYGLTESCGLVTACRQGDSAETIATTSGRAIPDVEVRCVDPHNQEVPRGEPGEIVVRGFNVMQGYFENEQATRDSIDADNWLHTGDIGVMDAAGNLRITDRLKDMFITGGFNCYPAEIEKTIANHPDIIMNAVIGVADERMGEVAKVFAVRKDNSTLTPEQLIAWCREHMANYKVPRQVAFVDSLPMNASGKVLKTELRALS
ncbi:FadD3 family acyl-CoA ligase [Ketobacter sp.]|uniref:FadD3 family acyl-CoA ligase n=1 Tax=Ketobacter sp. TaxID=2083498 RepID=UPI000F22C75F|nr:FadD3 family acyl-CoA ligase [Ketobacter sp.]RLT93122.1 MAG: fatty acid--CoA ligase family protein [Ketobacter sp.]